MEMQHCNRSQVQHVRNSAFTFNEFTQNQNFAADKIQQDVLLLDKKIPGIKKFENKKILLEIEKIKIKNFGIAYAQKKK